jgi:hypothetical protein
MVKSKVNGGANSCSRQTPYIYTSVEAEYDQLTASVWIVQDVLEPYKHHLHTQKTTAFVDRWKEDRR